MNDATLAHILGARLGKGKEPRFAITGGIIVLICSFVLIDLDAVSGLADTGFAWSVCAFGLCWQIFGLGAFVIGLALCVLPSAAVLCVLPLAAVLCVLSPSFRDALRIPLVPGRKPDRFVGAARACIAPPLPFQ
jgi:hypothetical protein